MLWGKDVDVPMHALHLGYGVGWSISPLITLPFITKTSSSLHYTNTSHLAVNQTNVLNSEVSNNIVIPFFISGALLITTALVYFIVHLYWRPKKLKLVAEQRDSLRDILNPGSCAGGDKCLGTSMTILFALFYGLHVAQQLSVTKFLFTYVVDTIHIMDETEATYLMMVNGICFTIGRGVMTFVSHCVPIAPLVVFELIVMFVASMFLAVGPERSTTNIWINTSLLNGMSGPVWPGGYTWASKTLILYTFVIALIDLGSQFSGLLFSWLSGYLLEYSANRAIMYFTALTSGLIMLLSGVIFVVTRSKDQPINERDQRVKGPLIEETYQLLKTSEESRSNIKA